jgi:hypothetical protein
VFVENLKTRRFAKYNCIDQVEENIMGGECSTNGSKRNAYRFLVVKPEGKRPLLRPNRIWVDNLKMETATVV